MTTRAEWRGYRRERARAVNLNRESTVSRLVFLDLAGIRILAGICDRSLAGELSLALKLAFIFDRDLNLASFGYNVDLAPVHDTATHLIRSIAIARGLATDRTFAHGHRLTHALTRNFARRLDEDQQRVSDIVATLEGAADDDAARQQTALRLHIPARSAIRVTKMASGLLPRRDRDRYAEEYRSELTDLAAAGAGQWRQLGHATRLLVKAGPLRAALSWAHRHRRKTA